MTPLPFRITTLNLWRYFEWERRFPLIVEYLRSTAPDVVVLQEVQLDRRHGPRSQVELLRQALDIPFSAFTPTSLRSHQRGQPIDPPAQHGQGILSRSPIEQLGVTFLRRAPDDREDRSITEVDVRRGDELFKVSNIHVSNRADWAETQLREYFGLLEERGETRILAGDFNHEHLEQFAEAWQDSYVSSQSLRDDRSELPYDYVLIPKTYDIMRVEVSDATLSDHRAVSAVIAASLR